MATKQDQEYADLHRIQLQRQANEFGELVQRHGREAHALRQKHQRERDALERQRRLTEAPTLRAVPCLDDPEETP